MGCVAWVFGFIVSPSLTVSLCKLCWLHKLCWLCKPWVNVETRLSDVDYAPYGRCTDSADNAGMTTHIPFLSILWIFVNVLWWLLEFVCFQKRNLVYDTFSKKKKMCELSSINAGRMCLCDLSSLSAIIQGHGIDEIDHNTLHCLFYKKYRSQILVITLRKRPTFIYI